MAAPLVLPGRWDEPAEAAAGDRRVDGADRCWVGWSCRCVAEDAAKQRLGRLVAFTNAPFSAAAGLQACSCDDATIVVLYTVSPYGSLARWCVVCGCVAVLQA
jgi:hypothetical protein